jgi:excisionase family DNA binding protein
MEDRWLSVDEIASYLGVSRDTIYNWLSQRGMPGRRVGRFWKFKKSAVDEWVESGGADDGKGAIEQVTTLLTGSIEEG